MSQFSDAEIRNEINEDKIRTEQIRNTELTAIINAKSISGEMFDLTATSLNNLFGYAHTIGILRYGINFPLSKFIDELTKILKAQSDGKSDKRKIRLIFLESCVGCHELNLFFELFCNSLNGGGEKVRDDWAAQQYYKNRMIITAAGGNIIILFAQLISNMIDTSINKGTNWDINAPEYAPITQKELDEKAKPLFGKDYSELTPADKSKLSQIFNLLTPTNQKILEQFKTNKEETYFKIVNYFINLNLNILESLYSVAKSPASDFDFKLSPNIHPSKIKDSSVDDLFASIKELSREEEEKLGTCIAILEEKLATIKSGDLPSDSGFLLLRVKTLIDNSEYYKPKYTPQQLKQFKEHCEPKFKRLYPQIMEEQYLTETTNKECLKFLNHLKQQKEAIAEATQYSINETIKFHLAGYYKPANRLGELFAVVNPSKNSTEAIFSYISNTTYNLNIYIQNWEQKKLRSGGAPAFLEGGVPQTWTDGPHSRVCENFLSLNAILDKDNGLVIRLCADILNYFLNYISFNTEPILDNLLNSFNSKRTALTGTPSECTMPPSHLILVPTNKRFNPSLKKIKDILNATRFSEHGYPDGIRITLNAIKTDAEILENKDQLEEDIAVKQTDPLLASSYDILSENPPKPYVPPEQKAQGYIKMKKVKTNKTRKKYKQLRKQNSKKSKKNKKSKKSRQYTSKRSLL